MNLVNMGMKYFGPAIAQQVASMVGIKSPIVTRIITAALPTLLGGLVGKTATAQGVSSIFGLLSNAQSATPEQYEQQLVNTPFSDLASAGGSTLSNMFGGGTVSSIADALSSDAGVSQNEAMSVLGAMAPSLTGMLKGQVDEQGLDAGGFAQMLQGQSQNIASAIPAGFASKLQGTDVLSGVSTLMGSASPAAPAAAEVAQASGGGGLMKWLLPLVAAAAAAWFFLGRGGQEAVDTVQNAVPEAIMVGDVNFAEQFTGATTSLTNVLGGITTAEQATSALPDLENISGQFTQFSELASGLGGDQKGMIGQLVNTAMPTITPMVENVIGIAGADSAVTPVLNGIVGTLTGLIGG